jgi:hypothetical protein
MLRYGIVAVAITGALAAGTLAQRATGRRMSEGGRGMMGRATQGDIAAWDGHVFVIRAGSLHRLGPDLETVKSVELPGVVTLRARRQEAMERLAEVGDEAAQQGLRRGMGMGMMMAGLASVAADSRGVYLLESGRITVYDHDLNEVKSADLAGPAAEEEEEGAAEEEESDE